MGHLQSLYHLFYGGGVLENWDSWKLRAVSGATRSRRLDVIVAWLALVIACGVRVGEAKSLCHINYLM